jgi:hypothetical protein
MRVPKASLALPMSARRSSAPEAERPSTMASPSRRQILAAAGPLAAAALVADTPAVSAQTGDPSPDAAAPGSRRARALDIRRQAALDQLDQDFPAPQANGDEEQYPAGIATYSKALPHNALGEPDPNAYRLLLQAIRSGSPDDFDRIPLGGKVKLANPQAAFAFDLEGTDPHALAMEPPPRFADEAFAGEMAECYWLALAREVPFSQYGNEPVTAAAMSDLGRFSDFADVTPATLFRVDLPGVQTGPYISQFLLQPYPFGSTPMEQRYRTPLPGIDHLTAYDAWLAAQNGVPVSGQARFEAQPRYIHNGRALGEWAHRSFSYQPTLVAALILLDYVRQFGDAVLDEANPYRGSPTQAGFVTFGAAHVLDLVARVANHAQKAAWYQKWVVHRRVRPEELGGRIHHHMTGTVQYPIHTKLFDSPALAAVFRQHGTYLCPQAYPEGCPTHPAYPGGNATFAAAGVTVLKAYFNEEFVIPNPVVPSEDGLSLRPWTGEPLTVGNELNKLAFNAAFGRNAAGVHFRRDEVRGILLGVDAARSVMRGSNRTYNENFRGFRGTSSRPPGARPSGRSAPPPSGARGRR